MVYPDVLTQVRHLYEVEHLSYTQIARHLGRPVSTVQRWLGLAQVTVRPKSEALRLAAKDRHSDIVAEILTRYRAGEAEVALARAFGVSRPVVVRLLRIHGVERRDRSAASYVRMARLDAEGRRALLTRAHSDVGRVAIATTRGQTLSARGRYEALLLEWLRARGYNAIPQCPVGRLNIDIAWPSLAIEVETRNKRPWDVPRIRTRARILANAGWATVLVWVTKARPLMPTVVEALRHEHAHPREGIVTLGGNGEMANHYDRL